MLHDRAMLITVSVSQWTARKHDANASKQVASANGAQNAGRFNKLLIDSKALEPIAKATSRIREYHYQRTLPWTDDGRRLLPSKLYFEYTSEMRKLKSEFDQAVDAFVKVYPSLVQSERRRLGQLYNPDDYPQDIRSRFGVILSPEPVPAANDFRVDIGPDIAKVREEIERATAERQAKALNDCWTRIRDVVTKVHERLSDPEAIFCDSLIENVENLAAVLAGLNFTDDPTIEAARLDLTQLVMPPDAIRRSQENRAKVAANAANILAKYPWTSKTA